MTFADLTNSDVFALTRQRRVEARLQNHLSLAAQHGPTRYHSFAEFAEALPAGAFPKLNSRDARKSRARLLRERRCARLMRAQSGLCYLCAKPFDKHRPHTIEHVMPRHGGGRNIGNILLACEPCNGGKGGRMPTPRESAILRLVNRALAMME